MPESKDRWVSGMGRRGRAEGEAWRWGGGGSDVSSQVAPLTSGLSGSPLLTLSRQRLSRSEGSLKGRAAGLARASPASSRNPRRLEKSTGFFPRPSAWGRGSLGLVTTQRTAHPDEPQPPGSCRAAKRTYPSWYFESGSSHARPGKGWLCAFGPGVGEWGGVKPERLTERRGLASCAPP